MQKHINMANVGLINKGREDDVLECFLYPKFCYEPNLEQISERMLLEEINKYNQKIAQYTDKYMWHREPLIFRPRTKQILLLDKVLDGSSNSEEYELPPHIHAIIRFDEDVGDEWFIVFLIVELTKAFEGLIARLVDADGEFLLIEAANVLPVWASPDSCQDRVFVHGGAIHVVRGPLNIFSELLNSICKRPDKSKMSDEVQAVVKKKIMIYPEEVEKRMHKARAFLPEQAASILNKNPGLIAPIIRTICNSDPLERKVCRAMKYFPPEQRIMINVKMTKCLYAMATHCRYTGDPRTGWNLPPTTSSKYGAYLLGVKIACGLELLVAKANDERKRRGRVKTEEEDDDKSKLKERAWDNYLKRLKSSGYFRGLLEDSQEYEKLYNIARKYFLSNLNIPNSLLAPNETEAEKVLDAWRDVQTCDTETQIQDEAALSPADSDSWLNIDPVQLEMMLNQQWGSSNKKPEQEPLSLREKVQTFLNQTSDIDGVQLLGERLADEEAKADPEDSGRIDFDTDAFDTALRDILDLVVPGGDSEFEGSSDGSLNGDIEDKGGELDEYMRLLDSQLQTEMQNDRHEESKSMELVETNLRQSIIEEAGGSGPTGNIVGSPIRRLMHLQLRSPTTVPPDLQS